MSSEAHIGPRPHRRPRAWKIVIIGLLLAALAEPIVMYRALVRERDLRHDARHPVELVTVPNSGK